jgi:hypothetical protein
MQQEAVLPSTSVGQTELQHHTDQAPVDLHDTQQSFAAGIEGTAVPPSADVGTTAVPSEEDFIGSLTSKVSALLPVPNNNGQQVRGSAPSSTPRRSRHISGAGVEFLASDLTTRAKKRTMKALKIIGENGSIDQQAEEYARIFRSPSLISTFGRWPLCLAGPSR